MNGNFQRKAKQAFFEPLLALLRKMLPSYSPKKKKSINSGGSLISFFFQCEFYSTANYMGIIGYKPQTLSNLLKSKMVIINPHQNEVLACVGLDNYLGFNFYFSSRKPIVEFKC